MDKAATSRIAHALGRLLAGAATAVLLLAALAAGPVQAQAPGTPPGQAMPDPAGVEDWEGAGPDEEGGYGEHDAGPFGDDRAAPPLFPVVPGASERPGYGHGYDEPREEELPPVRGSHVPGKVARMRTDGTAAIPRGAPKRVRALIAHYNRIVGKRYKWGGGHARLVDSGYDCSGAVGYGLIRSGMLRTTMVSGGFAHWGAAGAGRWVSVYAHRSHVYIEIAGLRLDTSSIADPSGRSGVRWRPAIGQRRGFRSRHPVGL